jgi:hypothetical protein
MEKEKMTETNGEIKPMPVPFEENAYKYADKQAELYRGLKEPCGGYANIVDAYIAGAKQETALLSQHIIDLQKDKGNLTDRVRELEQQIEKFIDFVLSKTECCDVCPITDTCINSEGTCPYAGILAKGEEEETRKWLMQFISKEIKEK